jgi:hypothetical protein
MDATQLYNNLQNNVLQNIATVAHPADPAMKERRSTNVLPSPCLLREIASHLIKFSHSASDHLRTIYPTPMSTATFPRFRERIDDSILTPNAISLPIDAVYKFHAEMRNRRTVTNIRLSENTKGAGGISNRTKITRTTKELAVGLGRIPTTRDLIGKLDPHLVDILDEFGQQGLEHPFLKDVFELIFTATDISDGLFHDRLKALSATYHRFQNDDLIMKLKMYIERADYRSYYVDHYLSRHFVGVVLQKIFLGVNMRHREKQLLNDWIPAKRSNILDWEVTVPNTVNAYLCKGDISSFTGSSVNTWVLVTLLLTVITSNDRVSELNAPFVVRMGDSYCEVELKELLFLYAYLTIGIQGKETVGEPFTILGGALGVSANIVFAKIAFAIEMNELVARFASTAPSFRLLKKTLSGDDFAFLYTVDDEERDLVQDELRRVITRYIGNPKELVTENMQTCSAVILSEIPFCKKAVRITTSFGESSYHVHIKSQLKLPFMSELIKSSQKFRVNPAKHISNFRANIRGAVQDLEGREDIEEGYVAAFLKIHGLAGFIYSTRHHYVVSKNETICDKGKYMTRDVNDKLLTMPKLFMSNGFELRPGVAEKLAELRGGKTIMTSKIFLDHDRGEMVELHHFRSELRGFSRWSTQIQESPVSISSCADAITNLFLTARRLLGVE